MGEVLPFPGPVERIEVVELRPGDKILVRVLRTATAKEMERISETVKTVWGITPIVCGPDVEVEVYRDGDNADQEEAPDQQA